MSLAGPVLGGDGKADALESAWRLFDSGHYEQALKAFKALSSSQKGQCVPCLVGMAEAQLSLDKANDAEESCRKALKLRIADARMRARALTLLGSALATHVRTAKELGPAEDSLRTALEADPSLLSARFGLGIVLLRQSRDEEGIAELRRFLAGAPEATMAGQARRLIENPRRARERFAPDFEVKTLGGDTISLQSLRGKVVLLDFWATWCAPCRVAIPELRDLSHRYPPDRFAIVSLSVDDDEELVRRFVTKNDMTWTLCHDAERTVQRIFRVNVFPTYLVIDAEGVIRREIHGTDPRQSVAYRLRATLDSIPELSGSARH